jgi:hypothetical protein
MNTYLHLSTSCAKGDHITCVVVHGLSADECHCADPCHQEEN